MLQSFRFSMPSPWEIRAVRQFLAALALILCFSVPRLGWSQTGGGNDKGAGSGGGQEICASCDPGEPPATLSLDAVFVSQMVPATMSAGQSYPVSVTLRNSGSKTWTVAGSFRLGSQNPVDNTAWGLGRVNVPASIAGGKSATFSFNVVAPQSAGNHNFQWRMVQDGVAWFGATSTNIAVAVSGPNTPPTVQLTSPANNGYDRAPASVYLAATAADAGGSVVSVSFWLGGTLLGTDASAPFSMALANVPAGNYQYKAIATDNSGLSTTSATTNFAVLIAPTSAAIAVRTYVYDTYERLCKTINPESGATLLDYDAAGNVTWVAEGTSLLTTECDRSRVAESEKTYRLYDKLNRVRQVST
ncbi:MAG: Ig-like domain-containing protein, partial [Pseudomonas sp.]|nr:Ig-like domain-containing protein [Pseudomonas sp.]